MEMAHSYWEENSNTQRPKFDRCVGNDEPVRMKEDRAIFSYCDSNLNFSTATCSEDDCEYGPYKKSKVARQDPMSHRIIEKRRRDRMNNCLADLSRLIPTEYLKKGRGRIEKTEIIEMAIKHMKHLQTQERGNPIGNYRLGYQECISEAMRFMVEVEGHFPREPICVRLLNHLQKHCEQLPNGPPATFASSPTMEQMPHSFPVQAPSLIGNGILDTGNSQTKINEYAIPKNEPENSNSNDTHASAFEVVTTQKTHEEFEKDYGTNSAMSYKYKTNIKLRFSQDLNAHEVPKRQKLDNVRRSSVTSYENQSSNQSLPPISEPCIRISESETPIHRQTSPQQQQMLEKVTDPVQRFSPNSTAQTTNDKSDKNFNVPIFVLHTKGSYYIPLTIDYKTLLPYLHNYNLLEPSPVLQDIVLHPVTINVSFLPSLAASDTKTDHTSNNKYKHEYNNNNGWR